MKPLLFILLLSSCASQPESIIRETNASAGGLWGLIRGQAETHKITISQDLVNKGVVVRKTKDGIWLITIRSITND